MYVNIFIKCQYFENVGDHGVSVYYCPPTFFHRIKLFMESGCPVRVYISLVPLYLNGTLKSSMRSGRRGGHFQDQVIKKQCVLSVITCPVCQQNTKYSWDLCNDRAILWKDPGSLSYHSRSTIYLAGSDHIGLYKKKIISNF